MAQEYEIAHVEAQPREWQRPGGGIIYYHRVYVHGRNKPIEVGKQRPNALNPGDKLYGDITPTEYPSDKFKAAPRDGQQFGRPPARSVESREKEQEGMAWGNALTNATNLVIAAGFKDNNEASELVYQVTKKLYQSRKRYELEQQVQAPEQDYQPSSQEVDQVNFDDLPF